MRSIEKCVLLWPGNEFRKILKPAFWSDVPIKVEILNLNKAGVDGTKVIPVIIKPCRFSRHESLSLYQAINAPDKPLMGLTEFEKEVIYDRIAERVEVNIKAIML